LKWQFAALEPDDRGVNETRGLACELVAWRRLAHLSELEGVECLLYELPAGVPTSTSDDAEIGYTNHHQDDHHDESTGLMGSHPTQIKNRRSLSAVHRRLQHDYGAIQAKQEPAGCFVGLNALEIAAVANAKRFLSQRLIQKLSMGFGEETLYFGNHLEYVRKRKLDSTTSGMLIEHPQSILY
jgi:hypothetical protein